jgi:quinoprotein relay system zinc metallohydrolase 2
MLHTWAAAAEADSAADFALTEVAPGVFVHHGHHVGLDDPQRGDSANIGFVVGARCVAVIDSGGSIAVGRALREAIARTTPKPVCYVINTHGHFDHVLGNAAFRDDHPQFVGHAELAGVLEASRDYFAERFTAELAPLGGDGVVVPTTSIADTQTVDLGQRELLLTAQPTAHTVADLTVLDRASNTLWSGDLVFMERLPVVDGKVRGWLDWMDAYASKPFARVVPGHGPVSAPWPAALTAEREYLGSLVQQVQRAIASGQFLEDVTAAAEPPAGWLVPEAHARNLSRVYREFEWQ